MNKQGKVKAPTVVIVILALALIVVGLNSMGVFKSSAPSQQTATGGSAGSSPYIVTTNPIIQIAGSDAQASGTAVTASGSQYAINSGSFGTVTLGSTTAIPGQTLELVLINNSGGYHNQHVAPFTVEVGSFPLAVSFNKNATVTENLYSTTSVATSDNGGATNQTSLGAGTPYNLKDEMTASALASTQDMRCIFELTAGVNASTSPAGVSYGNFPLVSTSTPSWYTSSGVNSRVWIYDKPALSTTALSSDNIVINLQTAKLLSPNSQLIKTCYTKEWFIDPNTGKPTFDVADSNNNVKSMTQYKRTLYFQ